MQGGEDHASPSVGLQAPVVVLPVLSGTAEDDEAGDESTGVATTAAAATEGVEETAGVVTIGDGAVVGVAVFCGYC